MALQELKAVHKSKFPDRDFDGELLEMGIKTQSNGKDAIVLIVKGEDEPKEVVYRGLNEAIVETKTGLEINDFYSAGLLVANLRGDSKNGGGYIDKKGVKHLGHGLNVLIGWDTQNKKVTDFQTDPPLYGKDRTGKEVHKHLWFKVVNETTKGGKDGEQTFRDFVIEKIQDEGKTIVAPDTPSQAQKPTGLTPELKQKWEDFLIENLTEPLTEAKIHQLMVAKITDAMARIPLANVRKLALQELVKENKLSVNDKAQYSVA